MGCRGEALTARIPASPEYSKCALRVIVLRHMSQMNWCNLPGAAPKAQGQFIYCTDDPYPKSIMQPNKVESIKQRITQLENRLSQELARESDAARKLRSRQAIILGTWLMKERPGDARAIADKGLRRDQDRAAFGLSPWKEKAPATPPTADVDILLPIGESGISDTGHA
jgi:hypothetical protein